VLACTAFGPYVTGFSTVVAYLVISTSAVESFENASFGSVIVQFAVSEGVFLIVVTTLVSAVVSASMITSSSSVASESSVASAGEKG
jgi:hypothetical protein